MKKILSIKSDKRSVVAAYLKNKTNFSKDKNVFKCNELEITFLQPSAVTSKIFEDYDIIVGSLNLPKGIERMALESGKFTYDNLLTIVRREIEGEVELFHLEYDTWRKKFSITPIKFFSSEVESKIDSERKKYFKTEKEAIQQAYDLTIRAREKLEKELLETIKFQKELERSLNSF